MREVIAEVVDPQHLLQRAPVLELLEVPVVGRDEAALEVLEDAGVGKRVEVAAEEESDGVGGATGGAGVGGGADLLELVHQHHGLDQLHVAELGVPVDVRRGNQELDKKVKRLHCRLTKNIFKESS